MIYVVYNPNNGEITKVGNCPPGDEQYQAGPGEKVLLTSIPVSETTHRVQNGVVVVKPSTPNIADPAIALRRKRNTLLFNSDWTQLSDNSLTNDEKVAWAQYRQALRDITDQDINNIVWPTPPKSL